MEQFIQFCNQYGVTVRQSPFIQNGEVYYHPKTNLLDTGDFIDPSKIPVLMECIKEQCSIRNDDRIPLSKLDLEYIDTADLVSRIYENPPFGSYENTAIALRVVSNKVSDTALAMRTLYHLGIARGKQAERARRRKARKQHEAYIIALEGYRLNAIAEGNNELASIIQSITGVFRGYLNGGVA